MQVGLATLTAVVVLALFWIYFQFKADRLRVRLGIEYKSREHWFVTDSKLDLMDIAAVLLWSYLIVISSNKIASEEKSKASKQLSDEINAVSRILAPYFHLRNLASFCFWAMLITMPVGFLLTAMSTGPIPA